MKLEMAGLPAGMSLDALPKRDSRAQDGRIKDAAEQFEGLLISELFKASNSATDALRSPDEDESMSTALQFAHEQLSQALAGRGGLGLAKIVRPALER